MSRREQRHTLYIDSEFLFEDVHTASSRPPLMPISVGLLCSVYAMPSRGKGLVSCREDGCDSRL